MNTDDIISVQYKNIDPKKVWLKTDLQDKKKLFAHMNCVKQFISSCHPNNNVIVNGSIIIFPCVSYLLPSSIEHSPSWEANRFSAGQEIPPILWNPKVHYCIHKCPPPVPIQSIPSHPTSWRSILILSPHLCLGLPSGYLPSGLPSKTQYTPLPHTCYMPSPFHLNFITQQILGKQYRSLSSSLCSFLHSLVTSSLS